MERVEEVQTDGLVLSIGGLFLFGAIWAVNPESLHLVALFGASSVLGLAYGLWRGTVWYRAGHWVPLAAIALMIAIAPSDSLIGISGLIIVVGVANYLFAPLYYWFEQSGNDLLK